MHIPKFREFISEEKEEKSFCKILIITDEPEEQKLFILLIDYNKRQIN